jgi:hypothetical protein
MHQTIAAPSYRWWAWLPFLLLLACSQEPAADSNLLPGRWEIEEAYRNGSPTTSLESLYFMFDSVDQVTTNLTGADQQDTYLLDGNEIFQSGGPLNVTYRIETLSEEQLILTTNLRNYDFRFVLQRASEDQ